MASWDDGWTWDQGDQQDEAPPEEAPPEEAPPPEEGAPPEGEAPPAPWAGETPPAPDEPYLYDQGTGAGFDDWNDPLGSGRSRAREPGLASPAYGGGVTIDPNADPLTQRYEPLPGAPQPLQAPTPGQPHPGEPISAWADGRPMTEEEQRLAKIYRIFRENGHNDEAARAAVAIAKTEGGLFGATNTNDPGGSYGTWQLNAHGQLPAYAQWLKNQGITGDPKVLASDIDLSTTFAAQNYLGQTLKQGQSLPQPKRGAELATYGQQFGQVSVDPWKAGQNYSQIFGAGDPYGEALAKAVPNPAARASANAQIPPGHYDGDGHDHGVATPYTQQQVDKAGNTWTVAFDFDAPYDHPFNPDIPRHRGVDLVIPDAAERGFGKNGMGAPYTAFRDGTVAAITNDPNGGIGVIVDTGDPNARYDRYFHNNSAAVKQGDPVKAGETVLGQVGETGTKGFPHLHYEVSQGIDGDPMGQTIDPRPYMSRPVAPSGAAQAQAQAPSVPAADGRFTNPPARVVDLPTPNTGGLRQRTDGIVVHSTNGAAANSDEEFASTLRHFADPSSQVSAHAVIAADGTIARVGNWDLVTWHAGENNANRVGIELAQTARDNIAGVPFTDAQYKSLAWLTGELSAKYGFPIDHTAIVGHRELEQGKRQGKIDPGEQFDWNRFLGEAQVARQGQAAPAQAAAPGAPAQAPATRQGGVAGLRAALRGEQNVVRAAPAQTAAQAAPAAAPAAPATRQGGVAGLRAALRGEQPPTQAQTAQAQAQPPETGQPRPTEAEARARAKADMGIDDHTLDLLLDWQKQRSANGQDTTDAAEFRAHLGRLGAPDPWTQKEAQARAAAPAQGAGRQVYKIDDKEVTEAEYNAARARNEEIGRQNEAITRINAARETRRQAAQAEIARLDQWQRDYQEWQASVERAGPGDYTGPAPARPDAPNLDWLQRENILTEESGGAHEQTPEVKAQSRLATWVDYNERFGAEQGPREATPQSNAQLAEALRRADLQRTYGVSTPEGLSALAEDRFQHADQQRGQFAAAQIAAAPETRLHQIESGQVQPRSADEVAALQDEANYHAHIRRAVSMGVTENPLALEIDPQSMPYPDRFAGVHPGHPTSSLLPSVPANPLANAVFGLVNAGYNVGVNGGVDLPRSPHEAWRQLADSVQRSWNSFFQQVESGLPAFGAAELRQAPSILRGLPSYGGNWVLNQAAASALDLARPVLEPTLQNLAQVNQAKWAADAAEKQANGVNMVRMPGVQTNWRDPLAYADLMIQGIPSLALALAATSAGALVAGPVGAFAAGAAASGLLEGSDAFQTARAQMVPERDAVALAGAVGVINGAIEQLPTVGWVERAGGRLLGQRASRALATTVGDSLIGDVASGADRGLFHAATEQAAHGGLGHVLREGLQEGSEEVLQNLVQNAAERTYNRQKDLSDGLLEGFVGGFLPGAALGSTQGMLQARSGRATPATERTSDGGVRYVTVEDVRGPGEAGFGTQPGPPRAALRSAGAAADELLGRRPPPEPGQPPSPTAPPGPTGGPSGAPGALARVRPEPASPAEILIREGVAVQPADANWGSFLVFDKGREALLTVGPDGRVQVSDPGDRQVARPRVDTPAELQTAIRNTSAVLDHLAQTGAISPQAQQAARGAFTAAAQDGHALVQEALARVQVASEAPPTGVMPQGARGVDDYSVALPRAWDPPTPLANGRVALYTPEGTPPSVRTAVAQDPAWNETSALVERLLGTLDERLRADGTLPQGRPRPVSAALFMGGGMGLNHATMPVAGTRASDANGVSFDFGLMIDSAFYEAEKRGLDTSSRAVMVPRLVKRVLTTPSHETGHDVVNDHNLDHGRATVTFARTIEDQRPEVERVLGDLWDRGAIHQARRLHLQTLATLSPNPNWRQHARSTLGRLSAAERAGAGPADVRPGTAPGRPGPVVRVRPTRGRGPEPGVSPLLPQGRPEPGARPAPGVGPGEAGRPREPDLVPGRAGPGAGLAAPGVAAQPAVRAAGPAQPTPATQRAAERLRAQIRRPVAEPRPPSGLGPELDLGPPEVGTSAQQRPLALVPVALARQIPTPVRIPTHPDFQAAIRYTPGWTVTPEGVEADLTRWQAEAQAGEPSARGMVFYLPAHVRSAYRGISQAGYGGTQNIQGRTLFKAPLFVKGATGGRALRNAYDQLVGQPGAYHAMFQRAYDLAYPGYGVRWTFGQTRDRVRQFLEEFGGDPAMAPVIVDHAMHVEASNQLGNHLYTAMTESVLGETLRSADYDSLLGYSTRRDGTPFISEVVDAREQTYPHATGETDLHPQFQPSPLADRPAIPKQAARPTGGAYDVEDGRLVYPHPQSYGAQNGLLVSGAARPRPPLADVGQRPTRTRERFDPLIEQAMRNPGYLPRTIEAAVEERLVRAARAQGTPHPDLTARQITNISPLYLPNPASAPIVQARDENGVLKLDKHGKPVFVESNHGIPSQLADLRLAYESGLPFRRWYSEFGRWVHATVGPDNIHEFRVIFGITSARLDPVSNVLQTLGVMRIARELAEQGKLGDYDALHAAIKAERAPGVRPGTRVKWAIFDSKIEAIHALYRDGVVEVESNAKTPSYAGNLLSAMLNVYDPNVTVDVWMARALNYHSPEWMAGSDRAYRASHAIFNWLAREYGVPPHELQAAIWFSVKTMFERAPDLIPTVKAGRLGEALQAARARDVIRSDLVAGDINEVVGDAKVADALARLRPVLARYPTPPGLAQGADMIYAGKGMGRTLAARALKRPISNQQREALRQLAEEQAPTVGLGRVADPLALGLENGQFDWLGIPHKVVEHDGGISVSLPGGNLDTARYTAAVAGLRTAAPWAAIQVPHERGPVIGAAYTAPPEAPFEPEQLRAITAALAPSGLPIVVDPRGRYVALLRQSAPDETLYNATDAVSGLQIPGLEVVGYHGHAEQLAAADFEPTALGLQPRFGVPGSPDLLGGAAGGVPTQPERAGAGPATAEAGPPSIGPPGAAPLADQPRPPERMQSDDEFLDDLLSGGQPYEPGYAPPEAELDLEGLWGPSVEPQEGDLARPRQSRQVAPPEAAQGPLTRRTGRAAMTRFNEAEDEIVENNRQEINERYTGDMAEIVVKEAVQNSVDASRESPRAHTQVDIYPAQRRIVVTDEGSGMPHAVVMNEFTKFKGSRKPEGASGGKGTAKTAILGRAQNIQVRTVYRYPDGQFEESVAHGNAEDYLRPSVGLAVASDAQGWVDAALAETDASTTSPVEGLTSPALLAPWPDGATGTRIEVTLEPTARWQEPTGSSSLWGQSPLEVWLNGFLGSNHLADQTVAFSVDGVPYTPQPLPPEKQANNLINTITGPHYDIDIYASDALEDTNGVSVLVQNNGLYQIEKWVRLPSAARLPATIIADVRSKVGAKDPNYPWSSDRMRLVSGSEEKISQYINQGLYSQIVMAEHEKLEEAIRAGLSIKGGVGKLFNTVGLEGADLAVFNQMGQTSYLPHLNQGVGRLHDRLTDLLEGRSWGFYEGGRFKPSSFGGFGISSDWIGLNVGLSGLRTEYKGADYLLLYEPWAILNSAIREAREQKIPIHADPDNPAPQPRGVARRAPPALKRPTVRQANADVWSEITLPLPPEQGGPQQIRPSALGSELKYARRGLMDARERGDQWSIDHYGARARALYKADAAYLKKVADRLVARAVLYDEVPPMVDPQNVRIQRPDGSDQESYYPAFYHPTPSALYEGLLEQQQYLEKLALEGNDADQLRGPRQQVARYEAAALYNEEIADRIARAKAAEHGGPPEMDVEGDTFILDQNGIDDLAHRLANQVEAFENHYGQLDPSDWSYAWGRRRVGVLEHLLTRAEALSGLRATPVDQDLASDEVQRLIRPGVPFSERFLELYGNFWWGVSGHEFVHNAVREHERAAFSRFLSEVMAVTSDSETRDVAQRMVRAMAADGSLHKMVADLPMYNSMKSKANVFEKVGIETRAADVGVGGPSGQDAGDRALPGGLGSQGPGGRGGVSEGGRAGGPLAGGDLRAAGRGAPGAAEELLVLPRDDGGRALPDAGADEGRPRGPLADVGPTPGTAPGPIWFSQLERVIASSLPESISGEPAREVPGREEPARVIRPASQVRPGETPKPTREGKPSPIQVDAQGNWVMPGRSIPAQSVAGKTAAEQVMALLKEHGVRDQEIAWTDLESYLKAQGDGPLSREAILAHVQANQIAPETVIFGGQGDPDPSNVLLSIEDEQVIEDPGYEDPDTGEWVVPEADPETQETRRIYRAYARDTDEDAVFEMIGSEFSGNWWVQDGNGNALNMNGYDSVQAAEEAMTEAAADLLLAKMPKGVSGPTRWSGFDDSSLVTPGGEDQREILVTLPSREGLPDFTKGHWDDVANVIVHVRGNSRTDADGKRMFFIDELQSDWHQQGRQHGYSDAPSARRKHALETQMEALTRQMLDLRYESVEWAQARDQAALLWEAATEAGRRVRRADEAGAEEQELAPLREARRAAHDAHRAAEGEAQAIEARLTDPIREQRDRLRAEWDTLPGAVGKQVPPGPYARTWEELGLKRAIRYAAEHGFERVGWTTGDMQNVRYSNIGRVSNIKWDPDEQRLVILTLDGQVMVDGKKTPDEVVDLIGAERAERLFARPRSEMGPFQVLQGEGLVLDANSKQAAAMRKFYDEKMPSIANDLGRAFGARVGQVQIDTTDEGPDDRGFPPFIQRIASHWDVFEGTSWEPDATYPTEAEAQAHLDRILAERHAEIGESEVVHTLDITPEMRASVMQGQPLADVGPEPDLPQDSLPPDYDPYEDFDPEFVDLLDAQDDYAAAFEIENPEALPRTGAPDQVGAAVDYAEQERRAAEELRAYDAQLREREQAASRRQDAAEARAFEAQNPVLGPTPPPAPYTEEDARADIAAFRRGTARERQPITDEEIAERVRAYNGPRAAAPAGDDVLDLSKFPEWAQGVIGMGEVTPEAEAPASAVADAQDAILSGPNRLAFTSAEVDALRGAILWQYNQMQKATARAARAGASDDGALRAALALDEARRFAALISLASTPRENWGALENVWKSAPVSEGEGESLDQWAAEQRRLYATGRMGDAEAARQRALDRAESLLGPSVRVGGPSRAERNRRIANAAATLDTTIRTPGVSPRAVAHAIDELGSLDVGKLEVLIGIRYNAMLFGFRGILTDFVTNYGMLGYKALTDPLLPEQGGLDPRARARITALEYRGGMLAVTPAWQALTNTILHGVSDLQADSAGTPKTISGRLGRRIEIARAEGKGPLVVLPLILKKATAIGFVEMAGRLKALADVTVKAFAFSMEQFRQAAIQAAREGKTGDAHTRRTYEIVAGQDPDRLLPEGFYQEMSIASTREANRIAFQGPMGTVGSKLEMIQRHPLGQFVLPFLRALYHIRGWAIDLSPAGALVTLGDVARAQPYRWLGPEHPFMRNTRNVGGLFGGPYASAYQGRQVGDAVAPLDKRLLANAVGMLAFGYLLQVAFGDGLSGSGPPEDPLLLIDEGGPDSKATRLRRTMEAQGWQRYSVKVTIGGQTRWVQYSNWGPLGYLMAAAAAIAETYKYGLPPDRQAAADANAATKLWTLVTQGDAQTAKSAARRFFGVTKEMTYLQGFFDLYNLGRNVSGLIPGVGGPAGESPGERGYREAANWREIWHYGGNIATSFIPNSALLNTLANFQDPSMRAYDWGSPRQMIANRVPDLGPPLPGGLSLPIGLPQSVLADENGAITGRRSGMPESLDVLGRPLQNAGSGWGGLLFRSTREDLSNPVLNALVDARVGAPSPPYELYFRGQGLQALYVQLPPAMRMQVGQQMGQAIEAQVTKRLAEWSPERRAADPEGWRTVLSDDLSQVSFDVKDAYEKDPSVQEKLAVLSGDPSRTRPFETKAARAAWHELHGGGPESIGPPQATPAPSPSARPGPTARPGLQRPGATPSAAPTATPRSGLQRPGTPAAAPATPTPAPRPAAPAPAPGVTPTLSPSERLRRQLQPVP